MLPEAQATAHYWAAVFGGHLSIGVAGWLLFAPNFWRGDGEAKLDPWRGVVTVVLVYGLIWETTWLLIVGPTPLLVWDSILDTVGVAFGAFTAAYIWARAWRSAAAACIGAAVVALAGALIR